MKKIIDVSDPADEVFALTLIDQTSSQNPNQAIGAKGAIPVRVRNKTFMVTKNEDSYTVTEGATGGKDTINLGV